MHVEKAHATDTGIYIIRHPRFSPALQEAAKAVPGMWWDGALRSWAGYADAVAACVARLRLEGLRIDSDALPAADLWREQGSTFLFATKGLRDYQVEGVKFLLAKGREGALLADGMRLGKSCQATTAARAVKGPTLIVCPNLALGVWGRPPETPEEDGGPGEIAKWWPDAWKAAAEVSDDAWAKRLAGVGRTDPVMGRLPVRGVYVLDGVGPHKMQARREKLNAKASKGLTDAEAEELDQLDGATQHYADMLACANVIVTHYDLVYAWLDLLRLWRGTGPRMIVIDEIHALQGHKSRRTTSITDLMRSVSWRIGLSGTPMLNRPRDLHPILESLSPKRFGYFFTGERAGCFSRLFCNAHQEEVGRGKDSKVVWNFDGHSNLDAPDGKTALTQEETLKTRMKHMMLRRVKSQVDDQLPEKTRKIIDVRVKTSAAVSLHAGVLGQQGKELRRCLDLAADAKLDDVIKLVQTHLDEEEKVVCFCYRRTFAEAVVEATGGFLVHGGVPQAKRDARINAFRNQTGPGVLVATIDTTSVAIDLSFCSVAVVGELVWEPADLAQMEERLYKFGKAGGSKTLVEYVIARGTGDELILRGVISKLDVFEQAIGPTGDNMRKDLAQEEQRSGEKALSALTKTLLGLLEQDKGAEDETPAKTAVEKAKAKLKTKMTKKLKEAV